MTKTSNQYPKAYLESVISLQRLVFVKLKEDYSMYSFCSLVNAYLTTSKIRSGMDKGNWSALNKGHKQILNDIDYSKALPKGDEPYITDFIAHWFADIYVLLQWTYNIPSNEIADKLPARKLLSIYNPLHEISEEKAIEKIYEKYFKEAP